MDEDRRLAVDRHAPPRHQLLRRRWIRTELNGNRSNFDACGGRNLGEYSSLIRYVRSRGRNAPEIANLKRSKHFFDAHSSEGRYRILASSGAGPLRPLQARATRPDENSRFVRPRDIRANSTGRSRKT